VKTDPFVIVVASGEEISSTSCLVLCVVIFGLNCGFTGMGNGTYL
jgi:hypothetical protein